MGSHYVQIFLSIFSYNVVTNIIISTPLLNLQKRIPLPIYLQL